MRPPAYRAAKIQASAPGQTPHRALLLLIASVPCAALGLEIALAVLHCASRHEAGIHGRVLTGFSALMFAAASITVPRSDTQSPWLCSNCALISGRSKEIQ
jgi:hypothetical protein